MKGKSKRILSFLMALSVFVTGSGIGNVRAAIAEKEQTVQKKQYTVTLPIYETCDYRYESSHRKDQENTEQNIILLYEAGEDVSFQVIPKEGWKTEKMQVIGNGIEQPVKITDHMVAFPMPEENLTFHAEFLPLESPDETITESTDENNTAELITENPREAQTEYKEALTPQETDPEKIQEETEDTGAENFEEENHEENFGTEEAPEETELWTEEASEETELCTEKAPEETELWTEEASEETELCTEKASEETELCTEKVPEDTELCTEEASEETELCTEEAPEETELCTEEASEDGRECQFTEFPSESESEFTGSEEESETVLEDTEETESEEATEDEWADLSIPEGHYEVLFPESTEYKITFCADTCWYQKGQKVMFTLEAAEDLDMLEIAAYKIKNASVTELEKAFCQEQLELFYEEKEELFSFEMPEANVLLLISSGNENVLLTAEEEEDPVPDRFKLVVSGVCSAPSILNNGHAASTHKTVVFFENDGSKIVREAYCIQPRLKSPGSGTVYDKDTTEYLDGTTGTQSERRMSKGMFYLYGGPAWGKTIELSDGSSVNLKAVMDNAGCSTNSNYYTITHYVLSYFYLNGTDWNYNSDYTNVLNEAGVALVKDLASYINRMPNPNSCLTIAELQATYQKSSDKSVTQTTIYKSFEENAAIVILPKGITLVNETTGEYFTGKATLRGGDRFHLEADSTVAAGLKEFTLSCKFPVDYQALKLGLKGYQDIGFSYYSGEKELFLKVKIPEIPKKGTAYVQKLDAISKSTRLLNEEGYSLAGAVYTIYKDPGCKEPVTSLTTTADGKTNRVELDAGTYYVKETKASKGYKLDPKLYTLKVVSGETATFTSYEEPIQKMLSVQKYDAESGKPSALGGMFEAAEYTVYLDDACTKKVTILKTDKNGYAKSDLLPLAVYYIKETKAPLGYELDSVVHRIAMVQDGETAIYPVNSREQPVKKAIAIQKYDTLTGNAKPYSGKFSFADAEYGIYSDDACTKKIETIRTNASGYAKSSELRIATYYIKEVKAPKGYTLDKTVHKVTMNTDKTVQVYSVKSEEMPETAKIRIQKYDRITGKAQPYNEKVSFRGAKYIIYSDAACTKEVEVLTTDNSGKAESRELPLGIYFVKETAAPAGYNLDKTIHKVEIDSEKLLKIYTVRSDEEIQERQIAVQKYDKETGEKVPANEAVSFQGAQYSVYSDAACTKEVDVMTTNALGYARSKKLPIAVYYVKETKRPKGYEIDTSIYRVDMKLSDQTAVYPIASKEQILRKPIEIQKYDKESGKPAPNNNAVSFEKAEYTIYQDEKCSIPVEVLVLNASGYAMSTPMLPGVYYLKETKAPKGYGMDPLIHEVTVADDGRKSYRIESYDPVIRGSLMLMKFLDDSYDESILQEWIHRGELSGIRFTLTHEDPAVADTEIITDQYGYAATKAQELVYGTWTLKEDENTTPEGYSGLKGAKIQITQDGIQVKYVVTNDVENAMLEIVKKDRQTGNIIPKAGAKFQILDRDGNAIIMQDNLDYGKMTDTFTTNEEGKIYLTKPLKKGTYTLKEIEAPENYLITEPVSFTVNGSYSYKEPLIVECFDDMQKGVIKILKKDSKTELALGEGFTFAIYTAEDITDPMGTILTMKTDSGSVELKKGTQVALVSTNADGMAQSPELYLGKYVIREMTSCDGYATSDHIWETELTFDRMKTIAQTEISVINEKTTLIIQKEDADATEDCPIPLSGICFRIFMAQELDELGQDETHLSEEVLATLGTAYVTDENGRIEIDHLLHATTYYIYEADTLPGYNRETGLYKISVDKDGRIEGQACYTLKISNQANQVEITKWDTTGDRELPGALLTLRDAAGNIVEQWISEEKPHRIKGLAAGSYTLTEDRAPLGYAKAETISFTLTDSLEVQQVIMEDEQIQVQISKKEITGQRELPGASLEIRTEEGALIESWISEEKPHLLNLPAGKYTLTEIAAPDKYAKAETILFEVNENVVLQQVEMYDAPIQVQISKQDITTEKELPGAQLTVRDENGELIEDWTSSEEPHYLNLAVGTYTLTEIAAPAGYCKAETITFEVTDTAQIQKVVMYDRPIEVEISKQDITGKEELPGALLSICDTDGNEITRWYSTEEPHRFQLPCGIYILTEIAPPDYYATAESVEFEVTETAELQQVVMKDMPLQVVVSKRAITGEEELPGAILKISDLEGNTIETWTSEQEPHLVRLKQGTYELTEITAPDGYETAETIRFTVEDTMKIQQVIMYDRPVPEIETETETETETEAETETETETELSKETESETETETTKESESETETETTKESETERKRPTTPGTVKTGDPTNFLPAVFGMTAGLMLLIGTVVSEKKKRRQNK